MDASLVIDQQTVLTYASFLGFALFGSFMRTMFGLYRGYTSVPGFEPERKRMAVEMVASTCFGVFLAIVLNEIGIFKFAPPITALFAGLFGTDLMSLLTKKLGISKGMNVILSESQMKYAGMTDKQIRAMEYAIRHGSVDNMSYRSLNSTDHSAAKRDLGSMVRKGMLRRTGSNRRIHYVPTRKFEGGLRAFSGASKIMPPKAPSGRPVGSEDSVRADWEACRRVLDTLQNRRPDELKKQ